MREIDSSHPPPPANDPLMERFLRYLTGERNDSKHTIAALPGLAAIRGTVMRRKRRAAVGHRG